MLRIASRLLFSALVLLCARPALAVDGQVLINESTINASGGYPYRITQPGSYKLTGNLTAPLNKAAIQIEASNVTLDLNGFAVSCSAEAPSASFFTYCISDNSIARTSITVRNGSVFISGKASVASFNFIYGISMQSSSGTTVEDIHFSAQNTNYRTNALQSGLYSIIRRNTFTGPAGPGFTCPSLVEQNVNGSGGSGSSGTGCVYVNNVGTF